MALYYKVGVLYGQDGAAASDRTRKEYYYTDKAEARRVFRDLRKKHRDCWYEVWEGDRLVDADGVSIDTALSSPDYESDDYDLRK